ncbi:long-chain fatty acid--CoA ligase [Amycolatopsis rubida]|uniref:Long-chain fatty acid--CoA ligase n=1 Tax=Amycolatopsis rubida TaxID=112413 RepID=A0ABX0BSM5_9PSEU|nr:AMP-binding protein [Amycolatopsis sp. M39]MYW92966.1 AMP-binding protein [Amycolatopsis rubida]NEC57953.1 long-chain fatty acid--CoA ligase [Amycolatopsis rubida]OAP25490.1 Long-chain-fatty-acid--CoA ligase [Amycolatopsis sp. M39]
MNVGTFLTKAARAHPARIAVDGGGTTLTYAELDAQAAAFADGLRRRGYRRGDRIALFLPNRAEYFPILFGLLKGGFVAVPVNAKLHPAELAYILDHSGARAVVVDEPPGPPAQVARIAVGRTGPGSFAEIVATGDAHGFADAEADPDDLAWLFYTSGTTGRPKGAMLSHRNLCASTMNALADMCDFQPEDVVLHVAPLSHGSGLYALPSIARGARNHVCPGTSFVPADVLATIEREQVTVIAFLAPTMIHRLLDAKTAPSTLRRIIYGGAPMDPSLAQAAIDRFGPIFVQLYGQGEAPMTITYLRPQDHRGKALSSTGIARTDVEVRMVDETGMPLPEGAEGEVCVRGDVVMLGYWNDTAATAAALRGGWLHTGDVGRFENGRLYLLSRRNDVIISGGSNIYPREVEEALLRHPAVREACVFGEPDPHWGESVAAAVVSSSAVEAGELMAWCRESIASFKKPKRIEFVAELPKNAYGKVVRRQVRDELGSRQPSRQECGSAVPGAGECSTRSSGPSRKES